MDSTQQQPQLRNVTNTFDAPAAQLQKAIQPVDHAAIGLTSFMQAERIQEAIEASRASGQLSLIGLALNEIPREVFDLMMVISLSLDSNDLNDLPSDLSRLILLQELSVTCNKISVFPAVILDFGALVRLDMSFNHLTHIPGGTFRRLKALKELNLANNSLVSLPVEMMQLANLETLCLEGNLLKELPEMGALKRLSVLVAYDNKLQRAPRCLPLSLETIDLSQNDIPSLLESNICTISALKTLDVSSNRLQELPRFRSPNLEELAVADNRLQSLSSLEDLPELRVLDASRNQLRQLPFSIGALQNLAEVHLRNNYLEQLPPSLGMCQQLRMLDVSDNKLETLPAELGQIAALTHLKFRHNNLIWVPVELSNLPHLEELDLFCNRKISNLPTEMTREETPAKAVLRYLSTLLPEPPAPPATATPDSSYRTPRSSNNSRSCEDLQQVQLTLEEEMAEQTDDVVAPPPAAMTADWTWATSWLLPAAAGAGAMLLVSWLSSARRKRF